MTCPRSRFAAALAAAVSCLACGIARGAPVTLGNDAATGGALQDGWTRLMFVNETDTYTNQSGAPERVVVTTFSAWIGVNRGRVTPFVVRVNGDNDFTVLAIGDTRVSGIDYTAAGPHTFPFAEAPPEFLLQPGETIATGKTDANPDGSGSGLGSVIPFDEGGDELWLTGNDFSGTIALGSAPTAGSTSYTTLVRTYRYSIGFDITVSTAPPSDIALDTGVAFAGSLPGSPIGAFAALDPNPEDDGLHTFALVPGEGGDDNAVFALAPGGALSAADPIGAAGQTLRLRVRATDPGGLWLEKAFALAVVAPSAPSAIRLDADRIVRGTAPGTAIGHLTAEDPDLPDDAHAFAFAAGDGDADNAAFALAGNALVLAGPLPPGAAHASLRLRATDRSGLPVEQAIAIPIRDPGVRINEIVAANLAGLEDEDGDTPDWIELFNESGAPVDVGGWFLTDNPNNPTKWQIPAGTSLAAGGYQVIFASGKDRAEEGSEGHANFSLSTEGEFLALIAADGATVADQIAPGYPAQSGGVSYGRTDTGSTLGFLSPPTPGAANGAAAYRLGANPVAFSHGRGFYQAAFALDLSAPVAGSEIRYTLDGSEPTPATGFRFTDPIAIAPPAGGTDSGVVTVRAVAFAADAPPGKAATHTYVFLDGATGGDSVADQSVLLPAIAAHPAYAPILGDAFKALPAVSITRPAGISLTEGEASVEFLPRGGAEPGFQIDGGIKIVGGASVGSPKNNFRLYFREEYGAARLDYDLFAGVPFAPPGADSFKRLNLRSGSHDTFYWLGNTANPPVANRHGDAQYLRNRWINDMQFAMGHEALRGRFAHVFLNGTYHGQYQFLEWPNDDYQAAYGGGEPADYEYTNGASAAKSGSDHWQPTWAALKDAAATNYALAQRWIDLENLADYMLLNFYAGNTWDWNPNQNWMASGPNQPDRGGWKFFCWDADIILQDVANDATVKNVPDGLFSILMQNHEAFRVLFRDRIFRHCSEGGALTADRASAIYDTGRAQIFDSIVAETARWQPAGAASAPWDRDGEWEAEYQHYQTVWFPQRTAILLSQLRARGWYPNDPPAFSHPGGVSEGAISLTLANPNPGGTIFYTLDGSDPYSGGQSTRTESILVDQGDAARALIPSAANGGDLLGDSWKGGAAFDDSAWLTGTLGVGYETGGGAYPALTGLDVAAMQSAVGSAFIRVEFTAPPQAEIDAWDELALNVKYDDGFVAWLNGVEVARANAFAGPQPWNAIAEIQHDDAAAVAFERFDITAHRGLLNAGGPNVLAIQGLNVAVTSSDFLILPQLAGAVIEVGPENPARREYTGAIPVDSLATVKARVLDASGEWSPLAEAEFTVITGPPVPAAAGNIEISEIHYHPAEEGAPEFIELHAPGAAPVDLSGAALAGGIAFAFPEGTVIPAGGYLIVASDGEAFDARYRDPGSPYYGANIRVAGQWQGALANGGEAVALLAAGGGEIVALTYDDGSSWPGRADGKGSSLELNAAGAEPADGASWRASSEFGGSPGRAGAGSDTRIAINEILANSEPPATDAVELFNASGSPVDLSHWLLSDSSGTYRKFAIPGGTVLAPGEFAAFTEADFNAGGAGNPVPFALSSAGDAVYLLEATAGGDPLRFAAHAEFGGTRTGESLGHFPDGQGDLYPMAATTFGATNAAVRPPGVAITEIHYNPDGPDEGREFLRLTNAGAAAESLGGWRLRGEIDFDFPGGASITLEPGASLVVVPFDPAGSGAAAAFLDAYGMFPGDLALAGPWEAGQKLDDSGGRLRLERPGDAPGAFALEEVINYDDEGGWPPEADGSGPSLLRVSATAFGDDPGNWQANPLPLLSDPAFAYQAWAFTRLPPGQRDPDANPDFDALTNFGEFAFLSDPRQSSPPPAQLAFTSGGDLALTFAQRSAGVRYTIRKSGDLNVWQDATSEFEQVASDPADGGERTTWRYTGALEPELFFSVEAAASE